MFCSTLYVVSSLTIIINVLLIEGKDGSFLQLVPFKISPHAIRTVPNTEELNEFVDRMLKSVKHVSSSHSPILINGLYKHFARWVYNQSISGIFQTNGGIMWNFTNMSRIGDAYIYTNEEDNVQVVAKFQMPPLRFRYHRYDLIFGKLYETGSVDAAVDIHSVDVSFTVNVKQNISIPPLFVCRGEVDDWSLRVGQVHYTLPGLKGNPTFLTTVYGWLTDHFVSNVQPQLETLLSLYLETAIARDDLICSLLVLCNSCSYYAADY
ncbi:hypothetical protein J6590_066562 [Homalodisca vitripennis]|nr:hypothetical protein J6590_066562 [Homalodisca vitripennis]